MKIIERAFRFSFIYTILFCLFSAIAINDAESSDSKKYPLKVKEAEVVRAHVGSGSADIGVSTPKEGSPEGPMSFALAKNRQIYILDQVNSRIQVFKDGKRFKIIPLPVRTAMDVDLIPDEKVVLLDNAVKKSLYFLDSEGKVLNVIPLEGRLIPYAPGVTGIQMIREGNLSGIWVEVEERSVRIASLDGKPSERISAPGRLSSEGRRLLQAKILGDITAVIHRSKEGSFSQWDAECTVQFNQAIAHLLGLWDDQNGRIYLGAFLMDVDEKGKRKYSNEILVLSPELKELGRVKLFVQRKPHEIFRPVRVSPEGHIFQMALDDRGVFVRRYTFRE